MRGTARLKKVSTSYGMFLLISPKEGECTLKNIDGHVFGVVDMQWRGVIRRAGNFKQVEHAGGLFRGRLDSDRGSQCMEELSFFVIEHIGLCLKRCHHYFLLD